MLAIWFVKSEAAERNYERSALRYGMVIRRVVWPRYLFPRYSLPGPVRFKPETGPHGAEGLGGVLPVHERCLRKRRRDDLPAKGRCYLSYCNFRLGNQKLGPCLTNRNSSRPGLPGRIVVDVSVGVDAWVRADAKPVRPQGLDLIRLIGLIPKLKGRVSGQRAGPVNGSVLTR